MNSFQPAPQPGEKHAPLGCGGQVRQCLTSIAHDETVSPLEVLHPFDPRQALQARAHIARSAELADHAADLDDGLALARVARLVMDQPGFRIDPDILQGRHGLCA